MVIPRSEGRIGPVNSQPELASAFPSHTLPRAFGPPLLENLQWPPGGLSSDSRADCHSKRPDTTYTLTQTSSRYHFLKCGALHQSLCDTDFWKGVEQTPD